MSICKWCLDRFFRLCLSRFSFSLHEHISSVFLLKCGNTKEAVYDYGDYSYGDLRRGTKAFPFQKLLLRFGAFSK